jgi:membrane protein involved in D-alanine export
VSFFGNFEFFCWLIPFLIPAVILGIKEKPLRLYSFFLSVLFILLIFGGDPISLFYLVGFYLFELHLVKIYLLLRKKYGRNSILYGHFILLAILPLIICKISGLFGQNWLGFLGISYLTFKAVQIVIESFDGVITEIGTFEFTNFLLFFPTLSCGPIDRSRRFQDDFNRTFSREEYLDLLGNGLWKLLLGIAYKFVLAGIFFKIMRTFGESSDLLATFSYMYSYGFYLFFDFAGYSLMAIGTSYILGIKTPDNFNKPFLSVDIKDFWNRWHITLSHWFRDFIFSRFMMKSIKQKWFPTRLSGAAVGFLVNMSVMGIWHGLSSYYIIYGIYHGILLALTEIYQKKSKFYQKHKSKKWYRVLSWFVTFQLVMFGFLIFSGRLNELYPIWIQSKL